MLEQLKKADRLKAVAKQVGFALWQLQELEKCSAQCFVLLKQATQGTGVVAGNELVEKAQSKTFGATIKQLEKSAALDPQISARFTSLLAERNWLVHQSRADSRNAIHSDSVAQKFVTRLDAIAEEALALLKSIAEVAEHFVLKHGVSKIFLEKESQRILERWRNED